MLKIGLATALIVAMPLEPAATASEAQLQSAAPTLTANLSNVQQSIEAARLHGLSGDLTWLEDTVGQLRAMKDRSSGQMAYFVPYWLAYADYALGSAYLRSGKRAEAVAPLDEAYASLGAIASPDVEVYALLALVAGQRVAVTPPAQIGTTLGQARDALEKALVADPANVRVIYARALADYTTPKEYGGGRVAEKFARSAVERPLERARPLRPGWGRPESAALLIRILRASNRADEAQVIYSRMIAEYPDSAALRLVAQGA